MKHKTGNLLLFLSKALLVFAILILFVFGQRFFYEETLYYFCGNNVVLLLYASILYLTSRVYNGFNFGNTGLQEITLSWVLCLIVTNVFQYFVLSLLEESLIPVLVL